MNKRMLAVCAVAWSSWLPWAHGADLVAMGATNSVMLVPNAAGQKVRIYLENRGDQAYSILGGTFFFSVAGPGPSGLSIRPRITSANMLGLEASPLDASRMMQTSFQGETGEWMTTLEVNAFGAGSEVVVQGRSRWPLCELELDTTGLSDGSTPWSLRLDMAQEGFQLSSFFNTPSAVDPADVLEVPVVAQPLELRLPFTMPPELPPVAVRFGTSPGSLVFEMAALPGVIPRIEYTEDLGRGTWRLLEAVPVRVESGWRLELSSDADVGARFFRTTTGVAGAGTALGTAR